jgi:MoaA/NifB/PqqE/SkfB family radical SAM enzyme
MKQWIYPPDLKAPRWNSGELTSINCITNTVLFPWLDANCPPSEWILKITGGEPGLYPEIAELIPWLSQRGYRTLVETNGSLPIPKADLCVRLAAWHFEKPTPKYFDMILIIENDAEDWRKKVDYCEQGDIPYITVPLRGGYGKVDGHIIDMEHEPTKIEAILHMYSMGNLKMCPSCGEVYGDIFNKTEPVVKVLDNYVCKRCPQTFMVDQLLS